MKFQAEQYKFTVCFKFQVDKSYEHEEHAMESDGRKNLSQYVRTFYCQVLIVWNGLRQHAVEIDFNSLKI